MLYRKKCTCEYNGSAYTGWQWQANGISIQEKIEDALKELHGEEITIMGSGRTDSGVHAIEQVFHYSTTMHRDNRSILHALNSKLPRDIAILSVEDAPEGFHAQRSAVSKTYKYVILNRGTRAALEDGRVWCRRDYIDVERLAAILAPLEGRHDFLSFCSKKSIKPNTVRTINSITVERDGDYIVTRLNANGFLHNMIRIIIGTAVGLVYENASPERMVEILEAKDRLKAGVTASPSGLYLERVYY
ncbi:MAG: tRNA pseudouridine(38-40) synthase TruA [Deferribacteraceae bacterium]|jgi:tRNA pseudouridine38-40 synthase|nr:tRNA pseudouridine(38-40) synthase TruA [Deferribacteraceae bacterium]